MQEWITASNGHDLIFGVGQSGATASARLTGQCAQLGENRGGDGNAIRIGLGALDVLGAAGNARTFVAGDSIHEMRNLGGCGLPAERFWIHHDQELTNARGRAFTIKERRCFAR